MKNKKYFLYNYREFIPEMSYYFFRPSRKEPRKRPLIVWLHGSGEVAASKEEFLSAGLPDVLNNWTLRPFSAYILCPQLMIEEDIWAKEENVENLMRLINHVIVLNEDKIDRNRIILAGHSLGAMGAMYVAERVHKYFACMCVLSGYECGVDLDEIETPALGIVGTEDAGEDPESVHFMNWDFCFALGDHTVCDFEASHEDIPKVAFLDDANLDGHSDLIEWMYAYKLSDRL